MIPTLNHEERNQMALDVLHYCNLFPKIWDGRACWLFGVLLHTITHPGMSQPVRVAKGNHLTASLKKDKGLWLRVGPFFELHEYSKKCRCKHTKYNHGGPTNNCTARIDQWNSNSPLCPCLQYTERPL